MSKKRENGARYDDRRERKVRLSFSRVSFDFLNIYFVRFIFSWQVCQVCQPFFLSPNLCDLTSVPSEKEMRLCVLIAFFLLLEKTRDAPRIGSHKNETSFLAFEARTVLYTYTHRHCVYIVVVVVVVVVLSLLLATDAPTTGTPLRPKQVLLVRVCVCIRARVDFW